MALAILHMGDFVLTKTMPDVIDKTKPDNHEYTIRNPQTQEEYIIKFVRNSSYNYEALIKFNQVIFDILKEWQWYVRIK